MTRISMALLLLLFAVPTFAKKDKSVEASDLLFRLEAQFAADVAQHGHAAFLTHLADMAASGDLGYTYGTYVFTSKNKEGKLVASYGKYTSIWKKQKDGQWKVVVDMGNSSPEPTTGK